MSQIQREQIDQLKGFLQAQQLEMVALLRRLVEAESPSSDPEAQEPVMNILSETLSALDFTVERMPGQQSGGQLMAWPKDQRHPNSAENGQPIQLLIGHCDTVWSLGTLQTMPFQVNANQIKGPGVYDMKGGLVQMLTALRAIKEHGWQIPVMPLVFINTDEELGSPESTPFIRQLAQRANRAFILEPALGINGQLKTQRKGVGRFLISVHGRAAHAGLDPEKGISAVLELSYLIQKLHALNDPAKGISVNVGLIEGGIRPNVIPPSSAAQIDVRVPTIKVANQIEQAIYAITPTLDGITIKVEGGFNRLPLEKTEANQRLWRLAQAQGNKLGLTLQAGMAGGGSDGNTTSLYTATLDGLGAVGDGAHADHEFLFADKMVERSALLALLLLAPPFS
jgi:glutamate carboxypeptidase